MKKKILCLGFTLWMSSLYADYYHKEEGILEDGARYTKESWSTSTREKTTEKSVKVSTGKRKEIHNDDLKLTQDLWKKEKERQKKERKNYEKLWEKAVRQENSTLDAISDESMEDIDDFEMGEIEE